MRQNFVLSTPGFVADPGSLRHDTGRQVNWDAVGEEFRTTPGVAAFEVEVGANASADAETVTVEALPGPLPDGTVLQFGPDKYVTLTAAAEAGATTLAVEPLTTGLADGDKADYAGTAGQGSKQLPAGLAVGFDGNGLIVPRSGSVAAKGILLTHATQDSRTDSLTGYGVLIGGHLYQNLLPDYAAGEPWTTIKSELGSLFTWQTYVDDRLS